MNLWALYSVDLTFMLEHMPQIQINKSNTKRDLTENKSTNFQKLLIISNGHTAFESSKDH